MKMDSCQPFLSILSYKTIGLPLTGRLQIAVLVGIKKKRFKIEFESLRNWSFNEFEFFQLIRNSNFLIYKVHQPGRSDQQKLKIFKKRRFLALHVVTIKLTYPGDNKNDQAHQPQR